jgi:hypothetical protein
MKPLKITAVLLALLFGLTYCGGGSESGTAGDKPETSPTKERQIRSYNLEVQKEQAKHRRPCDAIALKQYILDNYPEGTYLVEFDKTYTYSLPKPAVLDYKTGGKHYVFAVIAKSKEGERFIETKNIVGYESSFINLDSTKLGTAFFYLTCFKCSKDGEFNRLWEAEVPIHGGFNSMTIHRWKAKNILYVDLDFEDGIISGHRDFNYFFIDGIEKKPHLLETYEGIAFKRTMANVNNDRYPDYYEYRFMDTVTYVKLIDSIPFYWDTVKNLYVTKYNRRWWRKY